MKGVDRVLVFYGVLNGMGQKSINLQVEENKKFEELRK